MFAEITEKESICTDETTLGYCALFVGHSKPSVWVAIEAMQMDEKALATTTLIRNARGGAPRKRVWRDSVQLQQRLSTLCQRRRDGDITIEEFLRGVGHSVRLCDN